MKKLPVLFCAIVLIAMAGCKKDKSETPASVDKKVLISEIFSAGMAWNTDVKSLKSTSPINIQVDNYQYGTEGGYIHVLGSVTGSMSVDDNSGAFLGGTMLLGLTETINAYTFISNGQTYTINGAPYISLTGTFTLMPDGATFGTASSMQIGGGVRVTGPNVDETINIQITIIVNANGSGGHVSGTCGGESIDYTF